MPAEPQQSYMNSQATGQQKGIGESAKPIWRFLRRTAVNPEQSTVPSRTSAYQFECIAIGILRTCMKALSFLHCTWVIDPLTGIHLTIDL